MHVGTYDILKAIAHRVAAGETITIAPDWGLGSGTLIFKDGSHTHFGADIEDDEKKAVDDFIQGLGDLLVNDIGLSVAHPASVETLPGCGCPTCGRGHLRQEVPNYPGVQCDDCGARIPF